MLEKIQNIVKRINDAEIIFNSTASWEVKYDAIFAMQIPKRIEEIGLSFEYYDPDTSYEDDIKAYWNALNQFRTDLGSIGKTNKCWYCGKPTEYDFCHNTSCEEAFNYVSDY